MQRIEISYPSRDGVSTVRALLWLPGEGDAGKDDAVAASSPASRPSPRGLFQIVHGMSEHIERYEPFAAFLVEHGFAVCANDHVGHGRTALSSPRGTDELGHIPLADGENILVEDVHSLREAAMRELGRRGVAAGASVPPELELPYIIFGHSMGSFVARVYLTRHALGVRAAIICGTGQHPRPLTSAGRALTSAIARIRGERYRSALVHRMGAGGFARAIPNAATDVDWIATDASVVREYLDDPACGQVFTVGGYHTVSTLARDATDRRLAKAIPRGLPMFFIAGDEDPVGESGAGVRCAVEQYRRAGIEQVDLKLYHGYRHEILNEPCAPEVRSDVVAWLEGLGL